MNSSAALVALVPPAVTTVTSTVPVPAGAVAVMLVSLSTVKTADGFPGPKSTLEASVSPAPLMVTADPPVLGPVSGLTAETVGTGGVV